MLETANELLGRVNQLIDAADTLVSMAMDTGTTVGALFGSRALYDNLNRQLLRLDDITLSGTKAIHKVSGLMDTLQGSVPALLGKFDGLTSDVSAMMVDLKPLPQKLDTMMLGLGNTIGKVDGLMNKADNLLDDVGQMTQGLSDFMETTEQTLENADELMEGISNMWIINRNMPNRDSIPYMVETLW